MTKSLLKVFGLLGIAFSSCLFAAKDDMVNADTPSLYNPAGYIVTTIEEGKVYRFDVSAYTIYGPKGAKHAVDSPKFGIGTLVLKFENNVAEDLLLFFRNEAPYVTHTASNKYWGWNFHSSSHASIVELYGDGANASFVFSHGYRENEAGYHLQGHFYVKFGEYTNLDPDKDVVVELFVQDDSSNEVVSDTFFEYIVGTK